MSEVMEKVQETSSEVVAHPALGTVLREDYGSQGKLTVVANGHGGSYTVLRPRTAAIARQRLADRRPANGLSTAYRALLQDGGLRVAVLLGSAGYHDGDEYLFLSEEQADDLLSRLAQEYVSATLALDTARQQQTSVSEQFERANRAFKARHFATIGAFREAQEAVGLQKAAWERARSLVSGLEHLLSTLARDFLRVAPQGMPLGIPVTVDGVTYGVRGSVTQSDNYEGPDYLRIHLSVFVIDQAGESAAD